MNVRRMADSALARSAIVACCLLATIALVRARSSAEPHAARRPLAELPTQLGEWRGEPGAPLDEGAIALLGTSDFVNRVYSAAGRPPVALYVGYYDSQRAGDTMHSPLNCLPGAGWEPVARDGLALSFSDVAGGPVRRVVVNRLIIEKGLDRDLVLYWYHGHGRVVASEYWGRLLLALDAIRLNRTDGALVRIISPIAPGDPAAQAATERGTAAFVQTLLPLLDIYVPK